MSTFRLIDRDTGFLMPPSVDKWLPERHLAWFVVEVTAGLDLRAMTGSYRGSGVSVRCRPRLWWCGSDCGFGYCVQNQGSRASI